MSELGSYPLSTQASSAEGGDTISEEISSLRDEFTPQPLEDRIEACYKRVAALMQDYKETRDENTLLKAIDTQRERHALCPSGHPYRAESCRELARLLRLIKRSSRRTAEDPYLAEAIVLQREALELTPEGHEDRELSCTILANSLKLHYKRTQDDRVLLEVISLKQEILDLCPTEHPDRPLLCEDLAQVVMIRFKRKGDDDLLAQVIDLQREALDLTPQSHPDRLKFCANLVFSLKMLNMYSDINDNRAINEAIEYEREILNLCPEGHSDRAESCRNLAGSLWISYERFGEHHLLSEIIYLSRQVLALYPKEDARRAKSCLELARLLSTSFKQSGDQCIISEIIDIEREALSFVPKGHQDRIEACGELAEWLIKNFEGTCDESSLTEAINLGREALDLCPEWHPGRLESCGNLASWLMMRYKLTRDHTALSQAVTLQREVLALCSTDSPDRALACAYLALSLKASYENTGRNDLFVEAINLQREALFLCPNGHPDRSLSCGNLAGSLMSWYKRSGDDRHLSEAIELQREALALCSQDHLDRAFLCRVLSSSLKTRYEHIGDHHLIEEAIKLDREALGLCAVGQLDYGMSMRNLAGSLETRYKRAHDDSVLDEALQLERKVYDLCSPEHTNRASICSGLASTLWIYFRRTRDHAFLTEAIELQREASDLCPEGHQHYVASCGNLGKLLTFQYSYAKEHGILSEARLLLMKAFLAAPPGEKWRHASDLCAIHLHRDSPFYDIQVAIQYLDQSLQHEPDVVYEAIDKVRSHLTNLWRHAPTKSHHIALTSIYQRIITLLPLLSNPVIDLQSQLEALRTYNQIGSDAFVNALLGDEWKLGVEAMELAQGLIWAQRLHEREPRLQDVPMEYSTQLKQHLKLVSAQAAVPVKQTALTSRDILHGESARMYAMIREIRSLPGLDRFMLGETYSTLCTVASPHPVVVLVGARTHLYALIMDSRLEDRTILLPLKLTKEDLEASNVYVTTKSHRGTAGSVIDDLKSGGYRATKKPKPPITPINRYLKFIWEYIVEPVIRKLELQPAKKRDRPRLHWCPTGTFATVPLHAAGIYDDSAEQAQCCSDYIVSSYTPTLTSLLRAQNSNTAGAKSSISVALVAEKRAQDRNLPTINGVDAEINSITEVAKSMNVKDIQYQKGSTTVSCTSAAIKAADIVHLACHGIQDHANTTNSGFCLGDGRLTISDLMKLEIKPGLLAFLSACESAQGNKQQPDQAMHLAAAMLFSGFNNVIGSMWAISDEDGPNVARWFYEEALAQEIVNGDAIAYALDVAVGKLRASGVPPGRWAPFIHMGA